ncbi:laminin subunit gamma-1-like [Homalodisca vitripennis]|uniref:laminin subunit gamma-1-like n=1 Tax=Homalodisca vitripennis TaxID=197043 RepID=UPI001EEC73CF|nr:laminin subunit gamma-1-like [Homalodisca vitripennis]
MPSAQSATVTDMQRPATQSLGKCGECLHHTVGANCESLRCGGYYGDATLESATACQPCACPLTVPGNNFKPQLSCRGKTTTCVLSVHRATLAAIVRNCQGNTEGWRCEKCKPLHYGDPASYDCKPCECSDIGSVSADCHPQTGQCECKERFDGRSCNSCHPGLGNVTAGCVPCKCDSVGSTSALCDPLSGYCPCHPGVGGADCSFCLPRHYRFSVTGCSDCGCNQLGSLSQECDIDTGQCECL